jgi:nucleotidyltransferase substrate binding protein (TIGR01987 family)
MDFNEKLEISDMVRCADNFIETLKHAHEIETKNAEIDHAAESNYAFEYRFARSAVIHVFETTVESAWKMIQRWVKINVDKSIAEKPKRELFRTAAGSGLIADAEKWWNFFDARNKTSHTYHEEVAEDVYAIAKQFPEHLKDFIARLEERR